MNRLDTQNEYVLIREKRGETFSGIRSVLVPNLRWLPGFATLRLFVLVPLVCRFLRADVVVEPAHFGPFNLPRRVKRLTVIHDLTPLLFPSFHTFNGWFLHKLFLPGILRRSDLILCNSARTQDDVLAHFPKTRGKVTYLHLGVHTRFRPTPDPEVPARYGVTEPYFLFVGTIEPRKNLLLLLDAFSRVRERTGQSARLLIIGSRGWKAQPFYDQLAAHPYRQDIVLPGYVPLADLPALYSRALAFVYPSWYEGFGLPVVEALACGTPSLIANRGSLPEVAGPDAHTFEPDDPEELARLMRVFLEEPQRANLRMTSQEVHARYNWDRWGRQFEQILEHHFRREYATAHKPLDDE